MPTPTQEQFDAAYSTVFDRVHAQAYFHKLAERGYTADTAAEQQELLELGVKLAAVVAEQGEQHANQSKYASALSAFDQLMQSSQPSVSESIIKNAAEQLAADETIYDSVLTLASVE